MEGELVCQRVSEGSFDVVPLGQPVFVDVVKSEKTGRRHNIPLIIACICSFITKCYYSSGCKMKKKGAMKKGRVFE